MDRRTTQKFIHKNYRRELLSNKRIVITPGEPAGIGPDITLSLTRYNWPVELVVCASPKLLNERAHQLGLCIKLREYEPNAIAIPQEIGTLTIFPIDLNKPVISGRLCIDNSQYVVESLVRSTRGCLEGSFSALVTGPVHKGIINDANIPFTGHTEFLSKQSGCNLAVMMLTNNKIKIALVTNHIPLRYVSKTITSNRLREIIYIINNDLKKKFGIIKPVITVCGLNPHIGEYGYLGTEEIDIIIPTLNNLRENGLFIVGPISADTVFQPKYLNRTDIILTMYHDQGLPVLKYYNFNHVINVTLGLPFIRTSVGHGTALELAGSGKANADSLISALKYAINMIIITNGI